MAEQAVATPPPKSLTRDYVETILVCVIFVIFARGFVFQQSKIPSGSMMDTLLVGDYIMVNRFVYAPTIFEWERALLPIRPIRRGDVIVFKHPPGPETDFIKRVIGLPGDRIEVQDQRVWVNGTALEEPYVDADYTRGNYNFAPITIGQGQLFVMGDHRNDSEDSRAWGTVPIELVKGRALLIWWSFEEDPAPHGGAGFAQRMRNWGDKIVHFVGRSRWDRLFDVIR